jgi:multiple sugar transport system substrate-binding protein
MKAWMRPAAALTVALALAATGCGRESAGGQEQAKPVADGKATGEITVWAMGTEGEKLSALAADFMKENPDAKVKVTAVPWDGAHDKIATAIAGRQTPDVSLIGSTWMGEFARTGGLDALPDGVATKGDFYEGAWNGTVVEGSGYGVPWYVETRMLYVNKELAKKAGVTTPPKTQEELKAAVKAMKEKAGAPWGIYLQPGQTGSWQTFLPFVWQNGGDVTSGATFSLDSKPATDALAYYRSFFDEGLAPKDLPPTDVEAKFLKNQIGAFVSGPWHIGILKDAGGAGKYDIWHMPQGSAAATSFVGGGDLAVFKDAKNRDGAWKFVSWLSKPSTQVKWYSTVADLPANKTAWTDPALTADPLLAAFGEQLNDAKSPPTIATWEQIAAAIDGEVERVSKGTSTAQDGARAMQQKATSIGTGG